MVYAAIVDVYCAHSSLANAYVPPWISSPVGVQRAVNILAFSKAFFDFLAFKSSQVSQKVLGTRSIPLHAHTGR